MHGTNEGRITVELTGEPEDDAGGALLPSGSVPLSLCVAGFVYYLTTLIVVPLGPKTVALNVAALTLFGLLAALTVARMLRRWRRRRQSERTATAVPPKIFKGDDR